VSDPPSVGLQLGFTGTTQTHTAAGTATPTGSAALAGEGLTPPTQAGQQVLQLGQLDLRLTFPALRVLGEDVQDERGAVDDLHLGALLQVSQLRRGELAVADHRVGAGGQHGRPQVIHLAAADVGRRIGSAAALDQPFEHLRAGRLGQGRQLCEGVLGVLLRALGPHSDQNDPLQSELAVLDLGDVGQLGGEAGDPPQRLPLRQFDLAGGAVELVALVGKEGLLLAQPRLLSVCLPSGCWPTVCPVSQPIRPCRPAEVPPAVERLPPPGHPTAYQQS